MFYVMLSGVEAGVRKIQPPPSRSKQRDTSTSGGEILSPAGGRCHGVTEGGILLSITSAAF